MTLTHYLMSIFLGLSVTVETPPMPYRDVGACPFECCHYGPWTAGKPATARKTEDSKSPVAFQIKVGEKVTAVTGVVITRKPGTVRMQKAFKTDKFTLPAGALVYTLHYGGEGSTLIWFEGKVSWAELTADNPWDVLSIPDTEWWVEVRTHSGAIGWILQPQDFEGMDSCGTRQ